MEIFIRMCEGVNYDSADDQKLESLSVNVYRGDSFTDAKL